MLSASRQFSTDILVMGGGIMGLWAAVNAAKAGLSVTLVERAGIGSGASGGLLGALFPWMPDRWDAKKAFQFAALVSLPDVLEPLEAETGLSAEWRRVGRIIPLPGEHLLPIARRHEQDALQNWAANDERFHWHALQSAPIAGYIAPEFGKGGYVHDTLAARAYPRAMVRLLKTWLEQRPNVRLYEETALTEIDPVRSLARLSTGETVAFGHAMIAAGVESFPVLEKFLPPFPKPLGQGVKGQAALFKADLDPALPVAFLDGLYVVPHERGFVAVGSTSENRYKEPYSTDALLDDVVERARRLVPALQHAPLIERWAGIRPKAIGRDPLVGPVPDHPNLFALTGGFKISFGMAHALADVAIRSAAFGDALELPENFTLSGQIRREFSQQK